MATLKKNPKLSFYTQPWFVLAVVLACFAILTPKIFIPLFKQIFGIKNSEPSSTHTNTDRFPPPNMRSRQPPSMSQEDTPHHIGGRPNPLYNPQTHGSSSSSGKSILTFLLPVYAVGIGLYMMYTLFKVFNKNEKKDGDEEENDSDYDTFKSKTMKFRERNYAPNFNWDANANEFKMKSTNRFCRSEETEDELENYEKYKHLDPDYVEYIKELRRKKRYEARKSALNSKKAMNIDESTEIPVSKNIGLSSVTNTNVLMNETLERMKYSLNKINKQLSEKEKKGGLMDDPELDDLRVQLSQTEQQMAKIFNIINTVSTGLKDKNIIIDEEMIENNQNKIRHRKSRRDGLDDDELESERYSSSLNSSRSQSPTIEQKQTNLSTKKIINKVEELNVLKKVKKEEKKVTFNEDNNQVNKIKKKKNKKKNK
ncbi:unnamed protein product [Brachionus calyciflorus]|uniref:Resistance to inhibitors of cholinesterase protein 3 N-terminal domain-containing protein n=1 Tax=Brachionus calyciflorus TaxID=104777 RepID=A0A813W7Z8_9BILA|nr:unnamed protein product [Brachionus calyciflorus]